MKNFPHQINNLAKLTEALGIGLEMNGVNLERGPIRIEPRDPHSRPPEIVIGTVAHVYQPPGGVTKVIAIRPAVDFSALEFALVVTGR